MLIGRRLLGTYQKTLNAVDKGHSYQHLGHTVHYYSSFPIAMSFVFFQWERAVCIYIFGFILCGPFSNHTNTTYDIIIQKSSMADSFLLAFHLAFS